MNMSKKIYIKQTPAKGMGVFAGEDIANGELIEKCYLIKVDTPQEHLGNIYDYVFNYPQGGPFEFLVLPLGAGCVYNHDDNNNAMWKTRKDEEICTHYGDFYWTHMAERKPEMKKVTN